jgi:ACT domain-containing protein
MENVFVIQTDDKKFKEAMSIFLSKHCQDNDVNAAIYEMDIAGGKEVMDMVKEK